MDTSLPLFRDIQSENNLIPYLQLTGWTSTNDTNDRWYVLRGAHNADEVPLEIVIPKNPNARDLTIYVENAIDLLSGLLNESPQETIKRIVYYDRDVLNVRNLETGGYNSLALRAAARQVYELRQLVTFSACSERELKPYFLHWHLSIVNQMLDHYRFGHTFSGSFGFSIESPIVRLATAFQMKMFDEEQQDKPLAMEMPIERRVMERIVRGLITTHQATSTMDSLLLIKEYANGFNSNMCSAIVGMSPKNAPIEYAVYWSPKIKPADDISQVDPIQLVERSYNYLKYAAEELRQLKPEYVTVTGRVTGLTSKDNPLNLGTRRSVVIKGRYRPDMRPIEIIVELDKDDYVTADNAHMHWRTVQINGILSRSGYAWRLNEPTEFKVLE